MEMESLILQNEKPIEGFLEDCRLRNMTPGSMASYKSDLKIFLRFLKERSKNFSQADKELLKEFISYLKYERKLSLKTIEHSFTTLSSFYEYLTYEEIIDKNPILGFRKRYLRRYKNYRNGSQFERRLLSIEELSRLANSILDPRDKAIVVLLAKTGIRKGELLRIDVHGINWDNLSIKLKPTPKRSNTLVFFDPECERVLKRWLKIRGKLNPKCDALFISRKGKRIDKNAVYNLVTRNAEKVGLYNPKSPRDQDRFCVHCLRHWFSTWLLRSGMPREYVKELRGDTRNEAIDIYHHIDREELRKSYLAYIPQLGIA
jgi:integrase/recombinase XerD